MRVRASRPVSPYAILTDVPLQQAYPLYFLSEIITQYKVASQSTPQYGMELQIITKANPSAPWQLSLATGYDEVDGSQPPPLGMNAVPVAPAPPSHISYSYNPPPNSTPIIPASQYLPELAAYWQSWKTTGKAPANPLFVDDGGTSGFGAQIAQSPQDQYDQYDFHVDPNDPQWIFSGPSRPADRMRHRRRHREEHGQSRRADPDTRAEPIGVCSSLRARITPSPQGTSTKHACSRAGISSMPTGPRATSSR